MTYLAVLFMCINASCQVLTAEFKTENECYQEIDKQEKENKKKFDIFESRCILINYT